MKKSALTSWASLMAAFIKAQGIEGIGQDSQFLTCNSTQWDFVQYYKTHKDDVAALSEIKSLATKDYNKLKSFLDKNKFDSSNLHYFPKDTIGIAALLEIICPWECTPGITQLAQNSLKYKAICFNADCLDIRKSNGKHQPIFRIPLKNGDWVVVSIENFPDSIMGLNNQFMDLLSNSETDHHAGCQGIILPQVSIDYHCDMNWFLNLQVKGKDLKPYYLSQALHQNILNLNHEGVLARSASTIALTRSFEPDTTGFYKVDKPFLFAVIRPRVKTPLFVGYFMEDSWIKK